MLLQIRSADMSEDITPYCPSKPIAWALDDAHTTPSAGRGAPWLLA
jgi:hypothetical protein